MTNMVELKKLTRKNGRELSSYNDGTNNITYKYNVDGIRTEKVVNGVTTKYHLEGSKIVFEYRNGTMLYYIYNGDELIGLRYNNNTYYYHKNIFSDIIGILDTNYNEVVTYKYDSWGAISSIVDNSGINLGTINPFRYRSYYYDEETQLYYLNSRYYNQKHRRFINSDRTVSTGQGLIGNNMFNYCGNNTVNRIEIRGLFWKEVSGFIGSIFGQKVSEDIGLAEKSSYIPTVIGSVTAIAMTAILGPASLSFMGILTVSAYSATASATTKYAIGEVNSNEEYLFDILGNTYVGAITNDCFNFKSDIANEFLENATSSMLGARVQYSKKKSKKTITLTNYSKEGLMTPLVEPFCTATISNGKISLSSNCSSSRKKIKEGGICPLEIKPKICPYPKKTNPFRNYILLLNIMKRTLFK